MASASTDRMEWVDHAKAIGIMLVVYGHVARGLQHAGITMDPSLFNVVDSVIYTFHMPLFFFLSGLFFIHSLNYRGPLGTISNKLQTVLYPYIVWSLLQGLIEVGMSHYTNGNVTLEEISSLWHPRAQFWFLYALFMIMAIASFIFYRVNRIWVTVLTVVFLLVYISSNQLPQEANLELVYQTFFFFAAGILFSTWGGSTIVQGRMLLASTALAFVLGQWLFHGYYHLNYEHKGLPLALLAMVSILFVVAIANALARFRLSWLQMVGYTSLGIYLMHVLIGSGVRVILQRGLHVNDYLVHLLVGCAAGIVLPMAIFIYLDKRGMEFLFRLPKRRKSKLVT